ncbi:MAG: class I SAM-dependent methyltransferase [Elusimicrobiales bacterium]|nr:class I SAM-dependent methyltransferase [Elusimicrobiales bacterium]
MNEELFTSDIISQWKSYYRDKDIKEIFKSCCKDDVIRPYFLEYLPNEGKILEAGCGFGHWVYYLNSLGYKAVGVEIVPECVAIAKKFFPNIPIEVGDIRNLRFPDNYFDGYISIGVLEHLIEGPEQAIAEAKRVLKNNSIAIFIVPSFNYFMMIYYPIRKIFVEILRYNNFLRKITGRKSINKEKSKFKYYEILKSLRKEFWPIIGVNDTGELVFIEYKYKKGILEKLLQQQNFEIIKSVSIFHPLVCKDIFGDFLFIKGTLSFNFYGKLLRSMFRLLGDNFFCYMFLVIARLKKYENSI